MSHRWKRPESALVFSQRSAESVQESAQAWQAEESALVLPEAQAVVLAAQWQPEQQKPSAEKQQTKF